MRNTFFMSLAPALAASLFSPAAASAQQVIHTPSGTQLSGGVWVMKPLFTFTRYHADPSATDRDVDDFMGTLTIDYGVNQDFMTTLSVPYILRSQREAATGRSDEDNGFGDLKLGGKYRLYKFDTSPINTQRASLLFSVDLPTGTDPLGGDMINTMIGFAHTGIIDRHGFNAAVRWTFTTGSTPEMIRPGESDADLLNYDFAYVYRLEPAQYTAVTPGALYGILEMNGLYETNGDNEVFFSPGIMYEARLWVIEASVQLPISQDVDHRLETEFTLSLGLRFLY